MVRNSQCTSISLEKNRNVSSICEEYGTAKIKKEISPKLADQGIIFTFVGYTKDHEGVCYDILHPSIRTIYQICDVTWLKRMYYQNELDKYNEYLLLLLKEDDNNNDDQDDDDKVDITDTDGNESDSEDEIMS